MAKIVVNIKGLDALKRRLERSAKEIKDLAMDGIDEVTSIIQEDAVRNAPAMGDPIELATIIKKDGTASTNNFMSNKYNLQSIIEKKLNANELKGWVYIGGDEDSKNMSAYVNFGTGDDASKYLPSLSEEWQKMASQFLKDGKGRIVHNPYFTNAVFKGQDEAIGIVKKHIEKVK